MALPFEEYFDSLPGYVTVLDRDLRVVRANRRFREDFGEPGGRPRDEVYGDDAGAESPTARTLGDGQDHVQRAVIRIRDGRDVPVLLHATAVRDAGGEITAVLETATEIAAVGVQDEESRQRYQLLFDELPCFITIQDADLNIVEANRAFREAFGDPKGGKCFEVYKHRHEQCIPCAVHETFRDGGVHHSEEVVTSRSGRQINTLVYSAPIRDEDGRIKTVMEMSTDITPIRELQSQLEAIGLLISSVSHGVKGLLNGLDGGMYFLRTGIAKGDAARQKKGWEMVQRNVDRIRGQVLNILYYAKERVPNWSPVVAADLVAEVGSVLEAKARELDVGFETLIEGDAGEFDADPQAMRSLLVNLVENSLDACRVDQKEAEHKTTLRVSGDAERVQFQVVDNGIGMDQETREKAFTVFFSSKGAKGTGLGLFIANKIATAHGGGIELESTLDQGSRFVVTIPRRHEG